MGSSPLPGAQENIPQLLSLFPSDSRFPVHVALSRISLNGKKGLGTSPIGRGLWEREDDRASEVTACVRRSMALTAAIERRRSGGSGQPTCKGANRHLPRFAPGGIWRVCKCRGFTGVC